MNYCNKDGNMKGNLTGKDIAGVQGIYGARVGGGGRKTSVMALRTRPEHIDLFVTGNDGGIYTTFFNPKDGWNKGFRLSEIQAPAGASVMPLLTRPEHIDLFVVGKDGGIHSTFWNPQSGWIKGFYITF